MILIYLIKKKAVVNIKSSRPQGQSPAQNNGAKKPALVYLELYLKKKKAKKKRRR